MYMSTLKVVCYDDNTKETLPATNVELCDFNGKTIDMKVTNNDGFVESTKKYQIYTEKTTYIPQIKDLSIKDSVSNLLE